LLLKSYLRGFTENNLLEFLFRGINQFAYYIEGQLLEIGHKKSLLDYQVECGVIIIDTIDPIEIASACGWNIEYSYSLYNCHRSKSIHLDNNSSLQCSDVLRFDLGHDFPTTVLADDRRFAKSMAAFVRYCVENGLFYPFTKEAWRPINSKVFDKKGKPVTAEQLAQSYQDQVSKGLISPIRN
jgi:hypothetical protein